MNLKHQPQKLNIPALTSAFIQSGPTLTIPLDRQQYLYGLDIRFLGRLTTGGGAGAAVNAEAILNIFNRIRVSYNHEKYGSKTIINRSAASLFRCAQALKGTAPFFASVPALAAGNAAYDLEVHWPVSFPLEGLNSELETQQMLLDAPRCGQLNLELDFNLGAALVPTGGATTYAWAAYGGGGNPSLFVDLLQPNGFNGTPRTARVEKWDRNDSLAAAVPLGNQIGNEIPLGGMIARVWLKQYVTDVLQPLDVAFVMNSPKLQVAGGLSEVQFQINRKAIREWNLWASLEAQNKETYQAEVWPAGYGVIDFLEHGRLRDVLVTADLAQKKSIVSISGLVNALANCRLEVGVEEVFPISS